MSPKDKDENMIGIAKRKLETKAAPEIPSRQNSDIWLACCENMQTWISHRILN